MKFIVEIIIAILLILLLGFAGIKTNSVPEPTIPAETPVPHTLQLINNFRAEHKVQPLKINQQACEFAAVRAEEATTDWSHDQFFDHVQERHVSPSYQWSENLADNFTDPVLVVEAWKESKPHRATLLSQMTYGCVARHDDVWAFEGMRTL